MRELAIVACILTGCAQDNRMSTCLVDEYAGVTHPDVAGIYFVSWAKMTVRNNMGAGYTQEFGPDDFKVVWIDQSETPNAPTVINTSSCAGMLVPSKGNRFLESDCSLRMHQVMSGVGFYSMETTGYIKLEGKQVELYVHGSYRVPVIRLEGEQTLEVIATYSEELTRESKEMPEEKEVLLGARTLSLSPFGGSDAIGICPR